MNSQRIISLIFNLRKKIAGKASYLAQTIIFALLGVFLKPLLGSSVSLRIFLRTITSEEL